MKTNDWYKNTGELIAWVEAGAQNFSGIRLFLDANLKIVFASRRFYEFFAETPAKTLGRSIYEAGGGWWNLPALHELFEKFPGTGSAKAEFVYHMAASGDKIFQAELSAMPNPAGGLALWRLSLAIKDETPDPTPVSLEITDFISIAELQKIQEAFSAATGVASVITRPDGTPITTPSNFCRFCKTVVRGTRAGLENCMKSDAVIGRQNLSGPVVRQCLSGGLWDAGASITVGGRHVANWLVGQIKTPDLDDNALMAYAREIGVDENEYRAALAEVAVMPLERFQKIADFLFVVASSLSENAYQRMRLSQDLAELHRLDSVLAENSRLQSLIIDNATVGIAFVRNRVQEWANPRLAEMFLYTQKEFKSLPTRQLYVNEAAYLEVGQKCYAALGRGERYVQELQMRRKDGSHVWLRMEGTAINSAEPQGGSIWIWEDLTERKAAELSLIKLNAELEERIKERTAELQTANANLLTEAEERKKAQEVLAKSEEDFRTIFETSRDAVFLWGRNGFYDCNQAALTLFGFKNKAQLRAMSVADFSAPQQPDGQSSDTLSARYIGAAYEKGWQAFEWLHKKSDGTIFPSDVMLTRMTLRGRHIIHASVRDISARKKMEEALRETSRAAEAATRAKSEFLANMSHEIRTPMNTVIGMCHLVSDTRLTNQQRGYVKKIGTAAKALLQLINDILDFSKIEAGKLELEKVRFRMEDVISDAAEINSFMAYEKGLELLFEIDPAIPAELEGDPLRLTQILNNLISNAVKFTQTGEIVVVVKAVERKGRQVRVEFSVRDSGIGMSREQLGGLFHPFIQADGSVTRKYGGTGLGLAICHQLVTLMGGSIKADSVPGAGSVFSFEARFGVPASKAEPALVVSPPDLRGLRMLVTDDSANSREILVKMLCSMGFYARAVGSGYDALAELRSTPFDVVILDWRMPGLDGIETARLIKKERLTKAPKMLMVSAFAHDDVRAESKKAGIESFISKPVYPSALFNSIIKLFAKDGRHYHKPRPALALGASDRDALGGLNVLVVEDQQINQEVAREIIKKAGINVFVADDGQKAVELVARRPFDLVFMDVQMPVMDGFTATEKIRTLSVAYAKTIPVVAMTAHAMADDRARCLAAGMNDYITKPIDPQQVFHVLRKWTTRRAAALPAAKKPATPQDRLTASLTEFDVPDALARLGGELALYRKLLRKFAAQWREAGAELAALFEKKDVPALRAAAHKVSGSAGSLSAKSLHAVAKTLEKELLAGQSGPDGSFREFLARLAAAVAEIDRTLPARPKKKEKR